MNLFDIVNLSIIGSTCWCAAFAATNFGNKFGRLWGFQNNMGYKYISDENTELADKYYEQTAKMYKDDPKAESWAKDKKQLKERCEKYQYSLKYWADTVKYCVIKKNIRHKLVEQGYNVKDPTGQNGKGCTKELLNSFSDSKEDIAFVIARKECGEEPTKLKAAAK